MREYIKNLAIAIIGCFIRLALRGYIKDLAIVIIGYFICMALRDVCGINFIEKMPMWQKFFGIYLGPMLLGGYLGFRAARNID
jgi:hypothetical protein